MEEIWKNVIFNDIESINYKISNLGRIKNKTTNRILKQQTTKDGYKKINIRNNDKKNGKNISIHRAVAQTFIPNPENKPQVNHIDGNKENNCVDNLEWVTSSENINHAIKNNLIDYSKKSGTNHYESRFTLEDINNIRNNYIPKDSNFGLRALARKFNVTNKTISKILKNKSYKD